MTGLLKVAIIGAGASGLAAARHLQMKRNKFAFIIFEGTNKVGGTWSYSSETGNDEFGNPLHTSMYKNLRTNLPKQAMAYPGYPFKETAPCFLGHSDVYEYLNDFCDDYKIKEHIKFNTRVQDVKLLQNSYKDDRWEVSTFDYNQNITQIETFDAVMVCNGHYFVPNEPPLPGIDNFKGAVMHSHDYRSPEDFSGQSVVLLGARSSGTDIAIDLSKTARCIKLSNRGDRLVSTLPENVEEKPTIGHFTEHGVTFTDGSSVECDTFIYCTGYKYSFPFLDTDSLISYKDRVTPLYKHVVHIDHNSLSFVGLCYYICPFPMFHYQAAFACGVLDGSVSLPTKEAMQMDEEQELQERLCKGLRVEHAHVMGARQWGYNDELAKECGVDKLNEHVKQAYELATKRKKLNLMKYKDDEFVFCNKKNEFVLV